MEKTRLDHWSCPLVGYEISPDECFFIALVAEGQGAVPDSEIDIDPYYVHQNRDRCLRCKYHPR